MTPGMKATGTNTAISTAVVAMIGPVTSFIAARVAAERLQAGLELPFDVLDHDDRVVDDKADRQHHAEQAQHVQREAEHLHHDQRRDQRHRNGDGRDDRRAPALQEDEDDGDDEEQRLARVMSTSCIAAETKRVVS